MSALRGSVLRAYRARAETPAPTRKGTGEDQTDLTPFPKKEGVTLSAVRPKDGRDARRTRLRASEGSSLGCGGDFLFEIGTPRCEHALLLPVNELGIEGNDQHRQNRHRAEHRDEHPDRQKHAHFGIEADAGPV